MYTLLRGFLIALLVVAPMALVGCQQQESEPAQEMEEFGEEVEDAGEELGDAVEEIGEDVEEEVEQEQ